MAGFEYRVLCNTDHREIEKEINELAREGWELTQIAASVAQETPGLYVVMQRAVPDPNNPLAGMHVSVGVRPKGG